ncbi:MAG: hypothetical protein AAF202_08200, partial [Pseudomonadota bacterium]
VVVVAVYMVRGLRRNRGFSSLSLVIPDPSEANLFVPRSFGELIEVLDRLEFPLSDPSLLFVFVVVVVFVVQDAVGELPGVLFIFENSNESLPSFLGNASSGQAAAPLRLHGSGGPSLGLFPLGVVLFAHLRYRSIRVLLFLALLFVKGKNQFLLVQTDYSFSGQLF